MDDEERKVSLPADLPLPWIRTPRQTGLFKGFHIPTRSSMWNGSRDAKQVETREPPMLKAIEMLPKGRRSS